MGRNCWRCKKHLQDFNNNSVHTWAGPGPEAFGFAVHPDAIGVFEGPSKPAYSEEKHSVAGGAFSVKRNVDFSQHRFKMVCASCISDLMDGPKQKEPLESKKVGTVGIMLAIVVLVAVYGWPIVYWLL